MLCYNFDTLIGHNEYAELIMPTHSWYVDRYPVNCDHNQCHPKKELFNLQV